MKSSTSATLQHCPASEVPLPRHKSGAPYSRAQRDRGDDVIGVAGKDHTNRDLAIVGAVGGIKGAAAGIETDVAADVAAQGLVQRGGVHQGARGGAGNGYVVIGHFLAFAACGAGALARRF